MLSDNIDNLEEESPIQEVIIDIIPQQITFTYQDKDLNNQITQTSGINNYFEKNSIFIPIDAFYEILSYLDETQDVFNLKLSNKEIYQAIKDFYPNIFDFDLDKTFDESLHNYNIFLNKIDIYKKNKEITLKTNKNDVLIESFYSLILLIMFSIQIGASLSFSIIFTKQTSDYNGLIRNILANSFFILQAILSSALLVCTKQSLDCIFKSKTLPEKELLQETESLKRHLSNREKALKYFIKHMKSGKEGNFYSSNDSNETIYKKCSLVKPDIFKQLFLINKARINSSDEYQTKYDSLCKIKNDNI